MPPVPPDAPSPVPNAPARIGGYRIVRELGRGGMGVVYEAIQEHPERTVALKVVTASRTGSLDVLKRFEREAEVLGRLQHPGIAQIFEAGHFETPDGVQSFFAMELVRGATLTEYAENQELGIDERLDLLARIADAVQHAHERGIIHRDLKPGNVLINERGQPKVLDFGIARITDQDLRTVTLQTGVGQVIGTIPYMSPEQASGDPDRIDTRSDVYSLGVVGYELLAGCLPYELDLTRVLEAVRAVREDEARPLSSIDIRLRGDVETIIGKALQKEPDHRYATAAALADDIRRFLNDEPIEARPPSTLYQLRKFARRNRALVVGLAGVFVALVIGLVGTSLGYVEAEHRRAEADEAKEEALASAARAGRTSRFLSEILASISPSTAQGADTTLLRAILEDTEARIEDELTGLPVVEAEIRQAVGLAYSGLSDPARAEEHLRIALRLFEEELGREDESTIRALSQLGSILTRLTRFEEAELLLRESVELARTRFGPDDGRTLGFEKGLAIYLQNTGQLDEAARMMEDMLERARNDPDYASSEYLDMCIPFSTVLLQQDRDDEAEALLDEVVRRANAELGPNHPYTIQAEFNRVGIDLKRGKLDVELLERYRELWERSRRVHGDYHISTHTIGRSYGQLLRDLGYWNESADVLEQVLAAAEQRLGPVNHQTLSVRRALAVNRIRQGRLAEAEETLGDIVPTLEAQLGREHTETAEAKSSLGQIYQRTSRPEQAIELLSEAIRVFEENEGFHDSLYTAKSQLAEALKALDRLEEAESLQREVLAARLERDGPDHRETLVSRTALALTLGRLGKDEEAAEQNRLTLGGHRRLLGSDHTETGTVLYNIGMFHATRGDALTALPYLAEGASIWQRRAGPDHPNAVQVLRGLLENLDATDVDTLLADPDAAEAVAEHLTSLAHALVTQGRGALAVSLAERALRLRSTLEYDDPRLAWAQTVLGAAFLLQERRDEAAALLEGSRDLLDAGATEQLAAADEWLERLDGAPPAER